MENVDFVEISLNVPYSRNSFQMLRYRVLSMLLFVESTKLHQATHFFSRLNLDIERNGKIQSMEINR